jgi:glycine cleavage system regulatory protein
MAFQPSTRLEGRKSKQLEDRPAWKIEKPVAFQYHSAFLGFMKSYLVMTVLGNDRPGLVSSLADTVASHGGNWLESRMARLAGQFAGIVRIECAPDTVDALIHELQTPGRSGLTITAVREEEDETIDRRTLVVDVVGNDRPGIVRELSAAVASAGGNIEELTTGLESAPMSGHPMFRAHGIVSIPENTKTEVLIASIECLGGDLTVDVSL